MVGVLNYTVGPTSAGPDAYAVTRPSRGSADELVWESLCYATPTGYRPLFLDLHVPRPPATADPQPCPLVVWLHGGGWESGSRRRLPVAFDEHWFLQRIVLAGFAVAVVDYRLCAEAGFPAPVDDVRSALAWLGDHADDFGYDAGRLALWGESAGAHLALLAAAAAVGTPQVAAVVDWYGPTDLPALAASTTSAQEEGGEPTPSAETERVMQDGGWGADEASPVRVLGAETPPVFIAHGRDDSMVPIAQSQVLRDHLTTLGVPVEYHETDGGHVFEGSDALPDVLAWSLDFLGRHLAFDVGPHPELGQSRSEAGQAEAVATSSVEDTSIPGSGGRTIPTRIHRSVAGSDTVVLYLHGSRSGPGVPDSHGGLAARLSAAVPATVIQVARCLTAEHPSSADCDDCVSAVTWTRENQEALGGARLVLAGDGEGGDLALATALHCRDHGIRVEGLFLNYPGAGSRSLEELGGLCPVVVGVGALDSHFEDTLRFVYRLKAAAVPTRFHIFPTLGDGYCEDELSSAAAGRAAAQMCRDLSELAWDGVLA